MPQPHDKSTIYKFDEYEVDVGERVLRRAGERVACTPRMFDLLVELIAADGRLLRKEELLDAVWADAAVEEGNLNRTVSSLRKVLGESKGDNRFIETIPKAGYRFVANVEIVRWNGKPVERPATAVPRTGTAGVSVFSRERKWWIFVIAASVIVFAGALVAYRSLRSADAHRLAGADTAADIIRVTNNTAAEDAAMWTPDGNIRFLRISEGTRVETLEAKADGGSEKPVGDNLSGFRAGVWSSNGKRVIYTKKLEDPRKLFLASSDGSAEILLPFSIAPFAWSPDGDRVAYSGVSEAGDTDIFIYDVASGTSANVSNSPSFDTNPSFSPDGRELLFNSNRDGNDELYLMNADGSGVRRLTNHPAKEAFHDFSPDGTQIVFNSNRENETVGIYLMNLDAADPPVRISDRAFNSEIRPGCWSRDGTRIAFTSDRGSAKYNVYTMAVEPLRPTLFWSENGGVEDFDISPDGSLIATAVKTATGGELRMTDLERRDTHVLATAENSELAPAFSPDGAAIAFSRKADGNTDICATRRDGSDLRNLSQNAARDASPAWSADGQRIIFASDRDGQYDKFHLWEMQADGSGQRRVSGLDGYELTPVWSPDGRHFAFAGDRGDERTWALDVIISDGVTERVLARRRFHDASPVFSPDGTRIAFVSQSDGNQEIYIANVDGSGLRRITRNAANDDRPAFMPDGSGLLFVSDRGGTRAIYKVDLK